MYIWKTRSFNIVQLGGCGLVLTVLSLLKIIRNSFFRTAFSHKGRSPNFSQCVTVLFRFSVLWSGSLPLHLQEGQQQWPEWHAFYLMSDKGESKTSAPRVECMHFPSICLEPLRIHAHPWTKSQGEMPWMDWPSMWWTGCQEGFNHTTSGHFPAHS